MSLDATIKELKEQLAEEDKKEEIEEVVEEKPEEVKEEEKAEEKKEEPAKEEVKEEVKEEEPDNNAYRRMRREKAAAEKKAQIAEEKQTALEQELAALKQPKEEVEDKPSAPSPEMDEIVRDHRMVRAEREFQSLENKFKASNPEYDGVAGQYASALAQSIKIQNPRMSNNEIAEKTKETILIKAAKYLNDGFDPIEELYHEAKDLGFTGKSAKKEEPKEEEEIKPDMKKVAANRAKSTGMAATSGESKGQITKQAASELSVDEWAKLPQAEKRRLLYG